ncbi:MAG: large-conductance mechanosensitive channel protein MscL [Bacteroidota bacterium]|nr:large-conductance mechanosensitive channel protein MscL [Bacteroidota bacterium]
MKIIKEFKDFAMRGNMVDMAVGIIIGGAIGKIISSLVNDILMPPIGLLLGGMNFSDLKIELKHQIVSEAGKILAPAVSINYGNFIQTLIDFLIIAFAIFMMIRLMNQLRAEKGTPQPAPTPPEPTKEENLLTEIRDILKENTKK